VEKQIIKHSGFSGNGKPFFDAARRFTNIPPFISIKHKPALQQTEAPCFPESSLFSGVVLLKRRQCIFGYKQTVSHPDILPNSTFRTKMRYHLKIIRFFSKTPSFFTDFFAFSGQKHRKIEKKLFYKGSALVYNIQC